MGVILNLRLNDVNRYEVRVPLESFSAYYHATISSSLTVGDISWLTGREVLWVNHSRLTELERSVLHVTFHFESTVLNIKQEYSVQGIRIEGKHVYIIIEYLF